MLLVGPFGHEKCSQVFAFSPRDSTKIGHGFKKSPAPNIDYVELLQHFEKVQNKHLEVRHQRAGRGEHLDRRVIL